MAWQMPVLRPLVLMLNPVLRLYCAPVSASVAERQTLKRVQGDERKKAVMLNLFQHLLLKTDSETSSE
jgi:hypothetical protein